jgi:hypothetical protein
MERKPTRSFDSEAISFWRVKQIGPSLDGQFYFDRKNNCCQSGYKNNCRLSIERRLTDEK